MVSLTGPYCSLGHINQPLTQGLSEPQVLKAQVGDMSPREDQPPFPLLEALLPV